MIAVGLNIGLREAGRRWFTCRRRAAAFAVLGGATTVGAVVLAMLGMGALAHTQARPFTVFRGFAGVVLLASSAGPLLARQRLGLGLRA